MDEGLSKDLCVDASLWVRLIAKEDPVEETDSLFYRWQDDFDFFLAPSFLIFELTSALIKKHKRGDLTTAGVEEGLKKFYKLPIILYQSEKYLTEVWAWSQRLKETVAYDTSYLALAAWKKAPFYTADDVFYEKAKKFYPESYLV